MRDTGASVTLSPAARVRLGLRGPAVALHLLAVAYLLLCTRDRADWTIGVFKTYGDLMRAGHTPYRDFVLEYPPLAAPLLWLPTMVARGTVGYRLAFGVEALVFDLLGVGVGLWLVRRVAPHIPPWGIVLAQPLWLLCAGRVLVCDRFDVSVAVLMLLAIALVVARRPRLAWLVLGLATALKLYPVVLLPLFALVAVSGGRRWRLAGDIGAFAAAIVVPGLIVARRSAGRGHVPHVPPRPRPGDRDRLCLGIDDRTLPQRAGEPAVGPRRQRDRGTASPPPDVPDAPAHRPGAWCRLPRRLAPEARLG